MRLIESDDFDFEFLSRVAERESWRKEVFRPIYHVHKWWAKRLGSVFRGVLLGCVLPRGRTLAQEFYTEHDFSSKVVYDPFMGSGTTVGEAHKLGFAAMGRDINPIAVEAVSVALGHLDRSELLAKFEQLSASVGSEIRALYATTDRFGDPAEVLYFFWVMQAKCPDCAELVDLFSSYVIAANAYPKKKPEVQVVCPVCGNLFRALNTDDIVTCSEGHSFSPARGPARGARATCSQGHNFVIRRSMNGRPSYRLYGKLVLGRDGTKQYMKATAEDLAVYDRNARRLSEVEPQLPRLSLTPGYNTDQALGYGFAHWRDFFNDRQLLALGLLRAAIHRLEGDEVRRALAILFSGVLEFNNMFASYKGEGTGAVRHMFAHHILKPERTPIEANVWGTPKSSGSFSGLFRTRLLRALDYRERPTEVPIDGMPKGKVASPPFAGATIAWGHGLEKREISLSCGDSADSGLPANSVDLVVTDPPFFDNVHYSELADFFQAWRGAEASTTRHVCEVQDTDPEMFADKLSQVLAECVRVLKDDGLLVFSYHHSRSEGWDSLSQAVRRAGLAVVNAHPVKAEMSVAAPKTQAKDPIQLDILLVCTKSSRACEPISVDDALRIADEKAQRLVEAGFRLSVNDRAIIREGQLMRVVRLSSEVPAVFQSADGSRLGRHRGFDAMA